MHIVGLDIGFSARKRTNAIADYRDGDLRVARLSVEERNAALDALRDVDLIAIDAPILSSGSDLSLGRRVETAFSRGPFQKRCKPGMSHVGGTGRKLREHGGSSALRAALSARSRSERRLPRIVENADVVEAFPNAFLGVALESSCYEPPPSLKRGGKFDWLYDRWIERNLFTEVCRVASLPATVAQRCASEMDHEKRAALICLLTAACTLSGQFVAVGHPQCGYFFLPPRRLWDDWAWAAIQENARREAGLVIVSD